MVKSYRGKEINMDKLIQQQGEAMSLGNTNLNGFGDEIKNGKVVKTREQRLQDYLKNRSKQQATINIAEDKRTEEIEKELEKNIQFEETRKPKPRTKPQFIKEEETND